MNTIAYNTIEWVYNSDEKKHDHKDNIKHIIIKIMLYN